mgnify:CR=1 FL=1
MEMSEFEELMALAADMDGAKSILKLIGERESINLSNSYDNTQFCIDQWSPLYFRLRELLSDFVLEVEKKIEMLEVKTKEE